MALAIFFFLIFGIPQESHLLYCIKIFEMHKFLTNKKKLTGPSEVEYTLRFSVLTE